MKLIGDLAKLVEEANEARAILDRKATVEREISLSERQLGKLKEKLAETEKALEDAKVEVVKQHEHYEHERGRLAKDLQTFQRQCEDAKAVNEKALHDQYEASRLSVDSFRAQHAAERREVEESVGSLRKEHEALTKAVAKLKQQIGLL